MSINVQSILYVDEARIEEEHDRMVASDQILTRNLEMICLSLELIHCLLNAAPHTSDDEIVVQRLAVRCFNSGAAGLRLARLGYFNQCTALVRDIMETQLLMELFERDRKTIAEWVHATVKERNKRFRPQAVREQLEKLDQRAGFKTLNRYVKCSRLCAFGTHPSPEGFALMAIDHVTQIGPFADQGKLGAMLAELVKHLIVASIVFIDFTADANNEVTDAKRRYMERFKAWWSTFKE